MTRVAKHSSETFNINTRTNHKGIVSCNLWWCVGPKKYVCKYLCFR